jgi:hypothetical protein
MIVQLVQPTDSRTHFNYEVATRSLWPRRRTEVNRSTRLTNSAREMGCVPHLEYARETVRLPGAAGTMMDGPGIVVVRRARRSPRRPRRNMRGRRRRTRAGSWMIWSVSRAGRGPMPAGRCPVRWDVGLRPGRPGGSPSADVWIRHADGVDQGLTAGRHALG